MGPSAETVSPLVTSLRRVLGEYGAAEEGIPNNGAMNAPRLASLAAFAEAFSSTGLHTDLKSLRTWKLTLFKLLDTVRAIDNSTPGDNVLIFEKKIIRTLNSVATSLFSFVEKRAVTYPMKIVLLVTGFMPAYDRQVKRGLTNAGLRGFAAPQFLSIDLRHPHAQTSTPAFFC